MSNLETLILSSIFFNEKFTRTVLPHIKGEYFEDNNNKIIFEETSKYFTQYDGIPTKEALHIELETRKDLTGDQSKIIEDTVSFFKEEPHDLKWLVDTTEKWCRDRAIYNALLESIQIADGEKKASRDAIPSLLTDALAVSFDNSVGHDYIDDADDRFDFYHRKEEKIPFDISMLNKITKGGLGKKTLNIALAGTGVGKSLFMCHTAASHLSLIHI